MQRVSRVILAGLALMLALGTTVRAQVLEQVPADAWVVFKVNHLQETNQKIIKFAQALGIDQMVPQFSDPLESLKEELGFNEGVNWAGELAFVMMDPEQFVHDGSRDPVLILVPVSDYATFAKNLENAQADGEITKGEMPDGKEFYVTQRGNYAAMSTNRALIAARPATGLNPGDAAKKQLDQQDVVLYANVPAMRKRALPELQQNREQIINKMLENFDRQGHQNPQGAKLRPVMQVFFGQLVNGAENILKGTQAATIGISLTDKGIRTTSIADFASDSYIGGLVNQYQVKDAALLSGLPAEKYIFLAGVNVDPKVASQLANEVLGPIVDAAKQIEGPEGQTLVDLLQANEQMYTNLQGTSFGVLAPTAAPGQGALIQTVAVVNGDIPKLLEAYRRSTELQAKLVEEMGEGAAQPEVTYTENAKTIDGVTLNHFQVDLDAAAAAQNPEFQQAQMMMGMMFGPQGPSGYVGQISDNRGIFVSGLSDQALAQAVSAAKSGAGDLAKSQGIAATSSELPSQRIAVAYIPLDQIVSTAANYARQFGTPINVQLPPNLPPIGVAATKNGSVVQVDGFVPTELIQSLVAAGMQAFMGMQGGPQGGGL